jgi:hypothetical protein
MTTVHLHRMASRYPATTQMIYIITSNVRLHCRDRDGGVQVAYAKSWQPPSFLPIIRRIHLIMTKQGNEISPTHNRQATKRDLHNRVGLSYLCFGCTPLIEVCRTLQGNGFRCHAAFDDNIRVNGGRAQMTGGDRGAIIISASNA